MSDTAGVPGVFGKLASQGDFVARRLSPDFVQGWDAWLQAGMLDGRARHGKAWLGRYLQAPVWRFALAPGVCGRAAMAGVLLPSVDRVGRYFPLTLAAACAPPATSNQAWFDRVADLAVCAMCGDLPLAGLDLALMRLGPAPHGPAAAWPPDPAGMRGRAVFWTEGEPGALPLLLLSAGLPCARTLGEMLAHEDC
ncbi:type VI secretion system-associated protein TagF [Massilia sp. HP4]|uniref:type VI secretion system-associated protein TagF n=1 Tax=Massilia sp. HP4 TaxID=2562316 RepID=UPI001980A722|nr:type VI secretion system-associated protein TagF [Massilia sp. HP4]